jgi:hypothetical protein
MLYNIAFNTLVATLTVKCVVADASKKISEAISFPLDFSMDGTFSDNTVSWPYETPVKVLENTSEPVVKELEDTSGIILKMMTSPGLGSSSPFSPATSFRPIPQYFARRLLILPPPPTPSPPPPPQKVNFFFTLFERCNNVFEEYGISII